MKHIRIATNDDASSISTLRGIEYARSTEFKLIDPAAIVKIEPNEGVVLGAFVGKDPVATMCGTVVLGRTRAEEILESSVDDLIQYPALILTRAATSHLHRGIGLNSALRFHFFNAAKGRVESIAGAVYENAPRVETMKCIGYEFVQKRSWEIDVCTKRKRYIAVLRVGAIAGATHTLEQVARGVMLEYPWLGQNLELFNPDAPE